jgi:hypothetical protein
MKTDNFIMNILYIMGSITGMMMIGKLLGLLVGLSWWIVITPLFLWLVFVILLVLASIFIVIAKEAVNEKK